MTQYIDGIAEIPQSRCVVSEDFRTLTIPAKERTLGCVGDDETRRVWFDMPLSNDGISLRGFALSIHYVNAAGNSNRYDVTEAYVVKNRVLFAWLVQRGAYEKAGLVSMSIKMRALDGENVLDEFNSATAPFTVKPAHNYDAQPQPEQEDYIGAFIEQQEARVTAKLALVDEAIADAQEATAEATTAAQTANASAAAADEATAQANSAAGNANQAATDIREAAERGDFDGEKGDKGDPGEKGETGATGAPGKDGADGYSPTVTTEQTATGATITITDKNGAHTATIANGERGPQGDKGEPGDPATPGAITTEYLADGAVTLDKLYQPLAEAITLKGSDSGETVTTDDAAELPLYSLTVHGKSVQDGTPTPDAPVPVETVRTANLFNSASSYTKTFTGNTADEYALVNTFVPGVTALLTAHDGETMTFSADAVSTVPKDVYLYSYRPAGTRYTFTVGSTPTRIYITLIAGGTFTFGSKDGIASTVTLSNVQIESGNQANPYVPYGSYIGLVCGDTVTPIDLQGHEAMDLPDGMSDVLNVVRTGAIDVVRNVYKHTFDGTERFGITANRQDKVCIIWQKQNYPKTFYDSTVNSRVNCLSDYFFPENFNYADTSHAIGSMCVNNAGQMLFTLSNEYDTVAKITEFMTGKTVYYRLATPTTYQLPAITPPMPIDGGTVRVVANVTPEIDATWIKDATKAHGDIATTDASIAAVESTVATSNHAVGSYFVVDNQLYKATRAIATGETIEPGTNCTATTVMAELVALTS